MSVNLFDIHLIIDTGWVEIENSLRWWLPPCWSSQIFFHFFIIQPALTNFCGNVVIPIDDASVKSRICTLTGNQDGGCRHLGFRLAVANSSLTSWSSQHFVRLLRLQYRTHLWCSKVQNEQKSWLLPPSSILTNVAISSSLPTDQSSMLRHRLRNVENDQKMTRTQNCGCRHVWFRKIDAFSLSFDQSPPNSLWLLQLQYRTHLWCRTMHIKQNPRWRPSPSWILNRGNDFHCSAILTKVCETLT